MATAVTLYIPFTRYPGLLLSRLAIDNAETAITLKRQEPRDYIKAPLTLQVNGQTWQFYTAAGGADGAINLGDGGTMIIDPYGGDASTLIYVKGGTGAGFLNLVCGGTP